MLWQARINYNNPTHHEIFTQIVSFDKDDIVGSALQSLKAPLLLRSRTLQLCHFLL